MGHPPESIEVPTQTLNIGLDPSPRFDYLGMDRLSALNRALYELDVPSSCVSLHNGPEPTLVVGLIGNSRLSAEKVYTLASVLGQDAIAVQWRTPEFGRTDVTNMIVGPHAAAYAFDEAKFVQFEGGV